MRVGTGDVRLKLSEGNSLMCLQSGIKLRAPDMLEAIANQTSVDWLRVGLFMNAEDPLPHCAPESRR